MLKRICLLLIVTLIALGCTPPSVQASQLSILKAIPTIKVFEMITPQTKASKIQKPQTKTQSQTNSNNTLDQFEQEVVTLVNEERKKRGLPSLKADSKVSQVAEKKSIDMRDNNYFSHQSPTYGSPFDMLKSHGIQYRSAGENIAAGQRSPKEVVTSWMNSPGHRANILNKTYTHIGVGYVAGGSYGTYWTQLFIGK